MPELKHPNIDDRPRPLRKGGPRGPNSNPGPKESAKPTPKTSNLPLSKQLPKPKMEWASGGALRQKGDVSSLLTKVAAEMGSLRREHRKDRTSLLVTLYEIACHLRENPAAFAELRNLAVWEKHTKFKPPASGQPDSLKYVFRYAAGFSGPVSNDRSSRWTRALMPAFQDRLHPSAVFDLILKSGGIKKMAAQNRTGGDGLKGEHTTSTISSGAASAKTDDKGVPNADPLLRAKVLEFKKAIRRFEKVGLAELTKRFK